MCQALGLEKLKAASGVCPFRHDGMIGGNRTSVDDEGESTPKLDGLGGARGPMAAQIADVLRFLPREAVCLNCCCPSCCSPWFAVVHPYLQFLFTVVHRLFTIADSCSPLFNDVQRCSPLFTVVHRCSPLFTVAHRCALLSAVIHGYAPL
jgi:hypothetical protein